MNNKQILKNYFGDNYEKAMKTTSVGRSAARKEFLKQYPYADMSKFRIFVNLDKKGDIDTTEVDYIIDDDTLVDITSKAFKNNKIWSAALTWPSPWGTGGTIQEFTLNVGKMTPNSVKIFVTEDLFFQGEFSIFDISNTESNNYRDNSYLTSLYAAYIATYSCGISTKHFKFKPSVPKIVTSIARYHLYYHMMRFLKYPEKMSKYLTNDIKKIISDHKPTKTIWESKFHQGQEDLGSWLSDQARGTIQNAKQVFSSHGGQVGIRYEKAMGKTIVSLEDYMVFIAMKSNGLTKTGELLFQQSIKSYVYCVLGSQAKTRWPIVGSGARSLQTQEVFKKLVGDTILQDDHTVTLGNMRGAIKSTNVVLNTAVSPDVILIPSDMIILEEMIDGYNNVLTIVKSGMKFGRNENVNYFKHDVVRLPDTDTTTSTTAAVATTKPLRSSKRYLLDDTRTSLYYFLISGIIGSVSVWFFM